MTTDTGPTLSSLPHVVYITHGSPELPPEETRSEGALPLARNSQHMIAPTHSVAWEGHNEALPRNLDPGGVAGKLSENEGIRRRDCGKNVDRGLGDGEQISFFTIPGVYLF